MLVAVVVLLIICWAPILISNVLTSFDVLDRLNYGYLKPMRTAFHLLSYFNSCINPASTGSSVPTSGAVSRLRWPLFCAGSDRKSKGIGGLSRTGTTFDQLR
ncbi:hypothetical protein JTE90_015835 [Oedothorax gibbosus]|uniref:G-protein coupled receptors family 1 profile domain-containing protein n=1 Tax=Oedothorax gibbosus TaxID=931172 RepID=A0AAV6TNR0_9ARAC|nr:hypothetical protein JTE90_015835 [Oedothorax gibbosus]